MTLFFNSRLKFISSALAVAACLAGCAAVTTTERRPAEAKNMELLGVEDRRAGGPSQPVIQQQGSRYIAYIGHHGGKVLNPLTGKEEPNGTSIVDVTDPRKPRYLFQIGRASC